jgi:hypothetical protein
MRKYLSIAGFGLFGVTIAAAPAAAITVGDGTLADWNVTVADNNGSNFASLNPVGATLLGSTISDNNDNSNSYTFPSAPGGALGGGQNFDAEFMAVAQSGTHLYVAISTGQRPDNGAPNYEPGDLKITNTGGANPGVYGVELGSTTGAAITTAGAAGTTWKLDNYADAAGQSALTPANQTIGAIFKNAIFRTGAYGANGNPGTQLDTLATSHSMENLSGGPSTITGGGSLIGAVTSIYESGNAVTTQHQIMELDIDLETLLGTGTDHSTWANTFLTLAWGPACANDLVVTFALPPSHDIPNPEPATLAVFGLGVLGFGLVRRRKKA